MIQILVLVGLNILHSGQWIERHPSLFHEVRNEMAKPQYFDNGKWGEHWGDGALYAPAFDLGYGTQKGDAGLIARGHQSLKLNQELVRAAAKNLPKYQKKLEMVAMSLLSLIETSRYLPEGPIRSENHRLARKLLGQMDFVVFLYGNYVQVKMGDFASDTFGSTAFTAFMVMAHAEFAEVFPDDRRKHHIGRAEQILKKIVKKAWDQKSGYFWISPHDHRLELYPNATTLLAFSRLYRLTGKQEYKDFIGKIYNGIQGLKDKAGDHYHSPYSAAEMGAPDEDYATLSSQNYLIMGMIAAYEATREERYLEEIENMLTWIERKLLVDGRILHHWVNGHVAAPTDLYVFCLGCNFHTLYLLFMLDSMK